MFDLVKDSDLALASALWQSTPSKPPEVLELAPRNSYVSNSVERER